jgi:hypothetical protein
VRLLVAIAAIVRLVQTAVAPRLLGSAIFLVLDSLALKQL